MCKSNDDNENSNTGSAIAAVIVTLLVCLFALFIGVSRTQEKRDMVRQRLHAPYYIPGDRTTVDFTTQKSVDGIHIGDCIPIPVKDADRISGWRCQITLKKKE